MGYKSMFFIAIENPEELIQGIRNLIVSEEEVNCDSLYFERNCSKSNFISFIQNFKSTEKKQYNVVKLAFEFQRECFCLTYTDDIRDSFNFPNFFIIGLQFTIDKNISKLTNFQSEILVNLFNLLNVDFAWLTIDDYLNGNFLKKKSHPLDKSESLTYYVNKKFIKNIPQDKIKKLNSVGFNNGAIYYDSYTDFEYDENFIKFRDLLRIEFENYQK